MVVFYFIILIYYNNLPAKLLQEFYIVSDILLWPCYQDLCIHPYIPLLEKYPQIEFLDQNLSAFPLFSPNCVNYNLDQFSQYDELCHDGDNHSDSSLIKAV